MHLVAVNALELLHRPPPLWDRTCWYVPPAAAQHITIEVSQLEITNYSSNGGMMRDLSLLVSIVLGQSLQRLLPLEIVWPGLLPEVRMAVVFSLHAI